MKELCFILLIFCLAATSCDTKNDYPYTKIYVFVDVTDSTATSNIATKKSIYELLKATEVDTISGGYSGGEVKFHLINDISNTRSNRVVLKKGTSGLLGQNPFDRLDEIKKFKNELRIEFHAILDEFENEKNQSKIYQNLCREFANLIESKSDRKVIVIFSDMLENSKLLSFYSKNGQELNRYIEDIESTYNSFLISDCELPDLTDVDIYIVANRNNKNDELINLAEKFWIALFELKNANVQFDSELAITK